MSLDSRNAHVVPRRFLALFLIALLMTLSGYSVAQADTPAISKAKADAQALSDLINKLDDDLSKATENYDYSNAQLQQTQAAAKKTSTELTAAQKNLASARAQLTDRLVLIYKEGDSSMLSVLLGANSFSDLVNRFEQLSRISQQDALLVKQVKTYTAQVADHQSKLAAQLKQQKQYSAQTADAKQKVLNQLATQKQALKGKEAQVAQLQKEEAARQAVLAAAAKKAAAKAAADAAAKVVARNAALHAAAVAAARSSAQASSGSNAGSGGASTNTGSGGSGGGNGGNSTTTSDGSGDSGGGSGGTVPSSATGAKVVEIAMQYLGVPYVWAASSPSGFDCSGLVMYVYAKVGVSLPHSSRMQYDYGTHVSRDQLQPGDLVFFYNPIHHVGIYIGNGQMINATGSQVQISNVFRDSYYGATRIP